MNNIAVLIRHDLELNMTRVLYETLQVHGVIGKALHGLHLRILEVGFKVFFTPGNAHTLTASAGRGLDHNRKTNLLCHLQSLFYRVNRLLAARNDRNSCLHHSLSGCRFIAHLIDDLRRRTNERDAALLAQLRKARVFGKESESRMNSFCLHGYGSCQNTLHIQVTLI